MEHLSESVGGLFGSRVLVLNRNWQPVNIIGVKRAFSLLFQEHAQVIHSENSSYNVFSTEEWIQHSIKTPPSQKNQCIHTVRYSILKPKILLLNDFNKQPIQKIRFNKHAVFERDGYICQYCGHKRNHSQLNLDHVIPRHRGGRTSWENIVTSCICCNSKKANRLPHEAGMHLVRKPVRPKERPFFHVSKKTEIDDSWSEFLHV